MALNWAKLNWGKNMPAFVMVVIVFTGVATYGINSWVGRGDEQRSTSWQAWSSQHCKLRETRIADDRAEIVRYECEDGVSYETIGGQRPEAWRGASQ